jgi:cytoskeletal protein CcmA (bactofilin family)
MSMFTKKEETTATPKTMNQLGSGTSITGDIRSESDIRIDGKVQGNVSTKSKLVLGSSGVIDGDVVCQNAFIEGRINGKIDAAELLILSKSAFVSGDISIKRLVVEEGAKFNGKCTMGIQPVRSKDVEESTSVNATK